MAAVTYIRVTRAGAVVSGETGTWIPVSDLDLATMVAGTNAAGLLTFTLAGDDAIASTLTQSIDSGTPFKIEVATYDNSTATSGSAGTLLSYASSNGALGTSQSTSATTNANSFALTLRNISQTTYPPGGTASQSAFNYASNTAVPPTAVPADVQSGASVAASTSTAPDPSSLTYYARFATANGSYLQNIDGGTWFAVSGVSAGVTNASGNGTASLSALNLTVTDQAVQPTLLADTVGGKTLYGIQVEAVTASGYVADNTTYEAASISTLGSGGQIGVTYAAYYAQHFTASGTVSTSASSNSAATSAIAVATPTTVSAGQPTDSYFLAIDDVTGDTTAPNDARSQSLLGADTTGFVPSSVSFFLSNAQGKVAASDVSLSSISQALGLHFDGNLLTGKTDQQIRLVNYSEGTATGGDEFAPVHVSRDGIDLVSGVHSYSFAYGKITETNFGSKQGTSTSSGGYNKTRIMSLSKAYATTQAQSPSIASTQDTAATPSSQAQPEAVRSDAVVAANGSSNTSYIQFRDASGAVVSSSTGQTWFSVSAATTELLAPIGGKVSLSSLDFTIGQDAITGTLDTDLVAGTRLTAEVATYGGSNNGLQSDYIFGQSQIQAHSFAADTSAQTFTFAPTTFQETEYSSAGAATGTVTYDTSTRTAGMTATTAPLAPAGAPPTTTNAAPQALATYVQFVGSRGVPLTNSSGSSFFKIAGASSGLRVTTGAPTTTFGPLDLSLGDDQVTSQLDAAYLSGAGLSQVNVVTYNPDGTVESAQRYSTATVSADTVDNTGGNHAYSFTYTGYGESIAGTNALNASAATAGTATSAPSLVTAARADIGATTAPSLSTLAFYGELKDANTGDETFAGSSSGFITLPAFAIDLAAGTATFQVDQVQAASLAADVDGGNPNLRIEIAGYNTAGRSVDYVLSGLSLNSSSVDTASGLDAVTLGFTNLLETKTGSQAVSQGRPQAMTLDAPADMPPPVCFASGTLIRITRGDVPVEALRVGDLAVTASGAHRPIRWIGSRLTHCRRHPRPHEAQPVRVTTHAFGPNRPARDLLLSPGHSLCVDVVGEVLIPAMALVNGTTITQEDVDTVTYWHVELESHDILLAENMPAESYIEMGNRGFFAEADVVDLDASPDASVATHADFCRPFHAEDALVEVVRAQLAARAATLGWRLEEEGLGDLHLLVDGVRVEPRVRGLSVRFAVPAGAAIVWLVSGTTAPAAVAAGSTDRRCLGACLAALTLDDGFGVPRSVALDDQRLCVGFHQVERDGDAAWRWTAGRARLPASLWEGLEDDVFLRVDLARPALPRWSPPAAVSHAGDVPVLAA